MSGLFIELYLDEDVSVLVADLLKGRGFSALTTREAGNLGQSDRAQMQYAADAGKTLLTHNRADFEQLAKEYEASDVQHQGLILAERHPPYELVRRLMRILNQVTADDMRNGIRYI